MVRVSVSARRTFPPAASIVRSVLLLVNVAKVAPPSRRNISAPSASREISVVESSERSPVELRVRVVVGVIVRLQPPVISPPFTTKSSANVNPPAAVKSVPLFPIFVMMLSFRSRRAV